MTVAGFSGGEAEELRRAMGFKRSAARMEKIERRLREGMARNGITGAAADGNRAQHHFIRALWLSGIARGQLRADRLRVGLSEMPSCGGFFRRDAQLLSARLLSSGNFGQGRQRHGVTILPIDVAQSDWRCTIDRHALRLGLKYVAGLQAETGLRIERERRAQSFASIADFTARVAPNKRELDAIAYAGAFADFGLTRREALWQAAAVERDPSSLLAGAEPSVEQSIGDRDAPS